MKLGRAVALGLVVALIAGAGIVDAAGPYPNPLPNFAHPNSPHRPLLSPTGGDLDRPVLVVYAEFTDFPFPGGQSAAAIAQRYFGPFPTVANYFAASSYGKLILSPAAESDTAGGGAANDGVVEISIQMTEAAFDAQAQTAAEQIKQMVQAADSSVNFAAFDTNNDGKVTRNELIIETVKAMPPNICGANFAMNALSLDGKNLVYDRIPIIGSGANLVTLIHETAHAVLDTIDLYTTGVGQLDLMGGAQCTSNDTTTRLWELNAWHKTHLGWIVPTIVTSDGYYDVGRYDTTGAAYLLYDPSKNTDNYFLVENREPTPNTYDQTVGDRGLVIWRVDDSKFSQNNTWIVVMRPDGMTNVTDDGKDAWDPSDFKTPQRTMSQTWQDNSASNLAVRAIGDSGASMHVYFDVRGPGVLVDLYDLNKQGAVVITLGEAGLVSFPVRNTGEATDTFDFTATGLPAGWTSTTDSQTLGAGVDSTANIKVTPPLNAASTFYNLTATGTSQSDSSVTTSEPFRVFALRRQTTLVYTGALSGDYHDPANLSATLTDTLSGNPLPGKTVVFDLGTQTQSGTTDGSGIATGTIVVGQAPGVVPFSATFFGDATYIPSIDKETFTITKEQTTTAYIGPTVILQGASGVTLKAQLLEDGTTAPVPFGQTITLSLGAQSCTATTDASGIAGCTLTFNGALGPQPLKADFAGDTYYLPSSDTSKTAIVFAFPSYGAFVLGDDTVAAATESTVVTWWDSSWSKLVDLSGGDSPSGFKGFADTVVSLPTTSPANSCGSKWTSTAGNSPPPTTDVPSYMGVLVTSSVTKSGSTISGNFAEIVVVFTDPGYAPGPGHSGTGRIVAVFCQ
jgi:M6 family metalloprotease-like protein